jgi:sugar/nucleoside kinase (ribokinase family)
MVINDMKIICIGHAAYDITTPVENFPKENTKNRVQERIECGGGPAGTAAYLLGKWGMETYFAGIVGDDLYGRNIKKEYIEVGVNTDYLQISAEHTTTSSYIIANRENGSRTILTYRPSSMKMSPVDININPDMIIIDGQEPEISTQVLQANPNAISIIDAGRDRKEIRDLCKLVTYVACSKEFAESVSGVTIYETDSLNYTFQKLEEEFKTKVIITLESAGCAYRNEQGVVEIIPSIKVKAVDSTGAGDIFHGALGYAIAQGWQLRDCLRFANIAGAMSVTRIGGRYSIFELDEMLEVYNEIK